VKRRIAVSLLFFTGIALWGCSDTQTHTRGVYVLLDTSGTYKEELKRACSIVNYLLATLEPGDSLGVARIDTGSFSEKDIITRVTFDRRPSVSNAQKRLSRQRVDKFVSSVKPSAYTDITGGVLQAVEYLNETGTYKKYVLVFSDLKEELRKGYVRDFPMHMEGVNVVALNVTKLRSDNVEPREYMTRLDHWKNRTEAGGGSWRVVHDLERLDAIFTE
jgi:hypothetical protein